MRQLRHDIQLQSFKNILTLLILKFLLSFLYIWFLMVETNEWNGIWFTLRNGKWKLYVAEISDSIGLSEINLLGLLFLYECEEFLPHFVDRLGGRIDKRLFEWVATGETWWQYYRNTIENRLHFQTLRDQSEKTQQGWSLDRCKCIVFIRESMS